MVDLKNAKMEDFRIVRVHQRELSPDEKVRCTFYRLKPGTYTPKQHNYRHSPIPKEIFDRCVSGVFPATFRNFAP